MDDLPEFAFPVTPKPDPFHPYWYPGFWPDDGRGPRENGYNVSEELETGTVEYAIDLPNVMVGSVDLSTARVKRIGGTLPADVVFRQRLYPLIGAVVVASGHAEAALKRLILRIEGESSDFSSVDLTWTGLHKKLQAHIDDRPDDLSGLAAILTWGSEQRVSARRNDVVHGSWWTFDGYGMRISRFGRKSNGAIITHPDLSYMEESVHVLFEYASHLDRAMKQDWMTAYLPDKDGNLMWDDSQGRT